MTGVVTAATIVAAGNSQATATQIPLGCVFVYIDGGSGGVRMPPAQNIGESYLIQNNNADLPLTVYPDVGGIVNPNEHRGAVIQQTIRYHSGRERIAHCSERQSFRLEYGH